MNFIRINIFIVFFCIFPYQAIGSYFTEPNATDSIAVTFIINAGFLIKSPHKKILIDAFIARHPDTPPSALNEQIENAYPPFDNVDLILVTHPHADHFSAVSIGEHMRNNSNGILVGPQEVHDSMERNCDNYEQIKDRIIARSPYRSTVSLTVNSIPIKIFQLDHDGVKTNNGYMIDMEGKIIFHPGDAEPYLENYSPYLWLKQEKIFIAFINYWYLIDDEHSVEGKQIINRYLNYDYLVLMHHSLASSAYLIQAVAELDPLWPNVFVYEHSLEPKIFVPIVPDSNSNNKDSSAFPHAFTLIQNYPNPFRQLTFIPYALHTTVRVTIEIFNIEGQRIRSLATDQNTHVGYHYANWDGRDEHNNRLSSGIYFCRISADGYYEIQKIMLLHN
ncbi:MBL fold metallo-hydrolase [candidate division KSB1 bacterium]|nr:MBL fold metallo-hydrolase [candidate division KSB1 bacterium]